MAIPQTTAGRAKEEMEFSPWFVSPLLHSVFPQRQAGRKLESLLVCRFGWDVAAIPRATGVATPVEAATLPTLLLAVVYTQKEKISI